MSKVRDVIWGDKAEAIEASLRELDEDFANLVIELAYDDISLVKRTTEAMNGWVRFSPNEPRGARFSLVFPRRLSGVENAHHLKGLRYES